jgi:lipoate-protein ligase B
VSHPEAINWSPRTRRSDSLEVYLLGRVDFESAVQLQLRWAEEISGRTDRLGALFLCEHPPVVTIGREGNRTQLLADERELRSRLMELHWLNRGGGALVHAPGQLAAYPVVPLDRLGLGLADYRRALEQAMIETCIELQVDAARDPRTPGVFCRTGQLGWIASGVRNWITHQGLFLNVAPAMHLLRLVDRDPDLPPTTSLSAARTRPVSMHATREHLVRHLVSQLGYEDWHLYTGHPLLTRTRKKVHVPA